ncbi:protein FAM8A1 isoform X2 [Folsomia candida]|uniref:protein FAM8A1 isoform X2 n=1 Tax=Folsomia candida TaxID=158441 RepID=UPI001605131A|nr:protein FAM8A1 isoform X2 [Folsomia candida]
MFPTPSSPADDERKDGKPETMNDYCKKLETWLWQAYHQRSLATSAYFTALSNSQNPYFYNNNNNIYGYGIGVPDPNNPNNLPPQFNNINLQNAAAQQQQADIPRAQRQPLLMFMAAAGIAPRAGAVPPGTTTTTTVSTAVVVKLAPVWKRFLAEVIDFLFLLVVKLFITFTVIDTFELIDLDNIDLDALRGEGGTAANGADAGQTDAQLQGLYDIALSLTSELLLLELTHRIVVCFFEAYCLWKAGGTPGKTMLGLRVVHAVDILPFSPQRNNVNVNNNNQQLPFGWDLSGPSVIVRPGSYLTFPRALLRSCLKNFSLAFFFPLCFTLFHFDNSRTLYDLMAHSLVVEM